jgi:hypothetical protein
MNDKACASRSWTWPVKLDEYDRTPELKPEEAEALCANQSILVEGIPPSEVIEKCNFPRLMKPLEDVCTHIELQPKYWANLKAMMVRDVAARGRSYWGWTEEEWIASIKKAGHEKPSVASVGYLLWGFDALHKLGGKTFIFYGLAYRIFGREHVRRLFADVEEMLVKFGYRDRTARIYVPRAMCEVLVTNRSPHLEDLTVEVLQKVFDRRQGRHPTFFLSVISKVLANRKIISAPIKRMERPRYPNPQLLTGVPEKWAQAAKYWFENARYTRRVRTQNYYFLLSVGRWLGATHPVI